MTPSRKAWLAYAACCMLLYWLMAWAAQWLMAAPGTEFWHADDGSHYISGAMIAAWARAGFPAPGSFAIAYNSHYPIVGIGLWGPAFYVLQGAWMLVVGTAKWSVLALTGAVTAATATITACLVRRVSNPVSGVLAGAIVVASPLVVPANATIGLDLPVALFLLLAMLACMAFVHSPSYGRAALLAAAACFAMLIKGTALATVLLVPIAMLQTRTLRLLLDRRLLLAILVIGLVTGPWYLMTYRLSASGFRHSWGWTFTAEALPRNIALLYGAVGPLVLLLALAGAAQVVWSRRTDAAGAGSFALALSVIVFQSIVPAELNGRYLLTAVPALIVLAAIGAGLLLGRLRAPLRPPAHATAIAILAATLALLPYDPPHESHGYVAAAATVRDLLPAANPTVLVAGFDADENVFIAEAAMARGARPDIYIVRGSRLLGGGGYNNFEYVPLYKTTAEVAAVMAEYRIPIVVLTFQGRARNWLHVSQVAEVVRDPAGGWQRIAQPAGSPVEIYVNRRMMAEPAAAAKIVALSRPRRFTPP